MNTEIERAATTKVSKWTLLLRIKLSLHKHIQLLREFICDSKVYE